VDFSSSCFWLLLRNRHTVLLGAYIGLNADGTALGNGSNGSASLSGGVQITGMSSDNVIGGLVPHTRNVISANQGHGVRISGQGAQINKLRGNFIGTDKQGTRTAELGVLKNDSDPNRDELHAQLISGPAHGQLQLHDDGSFHYAPNVNFNRTDFFLYQTTDGQHNSETVVVTLQMATDFPWHNGAAATNVNDDNETTILDLAQLAAKLHKDGLGELPSSRPDGASFFDVSRDNRASVLDILGVVVFLRIRFGNGNGEPNISEASFDAIEQRPSYERKSLETGLCTTLDPNGVFGAPEPLALEQAIETRMTEQYSLDGGHKEPMEEDWWNRFWDQWELPLP
jgi:VCBS repeat-containing protein